MELDAHDDEQKIEPIHKYLIALGALDLLIAIQGALGTEETGDALVEVARNAHKAEQELAALKDDLEQDRMDRNLAD